MLKLRPFKRCDAEKIVSWIKDEHSFYQWSADRYPGYPIAPSDMLAQYDAFAFSDSFFPMTAFDEDGVFGHLILRFTDEEKSVVRLGFIIVDDGKRGKGYGKGMVQMAVDYAFRFLGASKVTLGVFQNNQPAFACYRAAGFFDTGERESYSIHGESWSCIEMAVLKK